MSTHSTHSLDELEIALDAAAAQMQRLCDENTRLRRELAEASERMRMAGHKLRVVAERLPQAAVVADAADTVDTNGAEVAQEKAA
jgi:hypothetical protein